MLGWGAHLSFISLAHQFPLVASLPPPMEALEKRFQKTLELT